MSKACAASPLKSPYPYFGGKSRVAGLIWSRFGDVPNYVEPFFGSGAVLLGRPHPPKTETVNDLNAFICNFWRAVKSDPAAVAEHCSFPVNENHLHSVHQWLVLKVGEDGLRAKLDADPDYFDPLVAGRWVWGASAWLGRQWCSKGGMTRTRPHLGNQGQGIHANRCDDLPAYFKSLMARFRRVRICCGDWERVVGPSTTFKLQNAEMKTAVFLDPPYAIEAGRDERLYANEDLGIAHAVREWAIANGDNPLMRICLAGYEGEHELPDSWECVPWSAAGGYNSTEGDNRHKERLWFSPYCIKPERNRSLFDVMAD